MNLLANFGWIQIFQFRRVRICNCLDLHLEQFTRPQRHLTVTSRTDYTFIFVFVSRHFSEFSRFGDQVGHTRQALYSGKAGDNQRPRMRLNLTMSDASKLRRCALSSGLVTQEDLIRAESVSRAGETDGVSGDGLSDQELADNLVELGIVTTYQVQQLQAGRTRFDLGPYVITDWIGQGGTGHVYKGVHHVLGRECAIKVLPPNKSTPGDINNFAYQMRLLAKLDHANLVRLYDAGRAGDVHYLVTEFVPGPDLRRLIHSQGPLTVQKAAGVITLAARGLEYVHQNGLIHRDVKPGSVLVTSDGTTKLCDLRSAIPCQRSGDEYLAEKIRGRPDYVSPEELRDPPEVTNLIDIYSLGCTLYYAVTGKVPFPGGTAENKVERIRTKTPWHPRQFAPDISDEFAEVIADMMEKIPEKRIQSAAEVIRRLEPWANDLQ